MNTDGFGVLALLTVRVERCGSILRMIDVADHCGHRQNAKRYNVQITWALDLMPTFASGFLVYDALS